MGEQRHDEAHRLGRGAQAVKHRACGGAERLMALVADEPLFLLRMNTDIAPASLASGRAVPIGAECVVGSMTLLLAVRGNIATRSMSGPPFALQLHRTTVWCGATLNPVLCSIAIQGPHPARGTQWPRCHRGQCGAAPVGPCGGRWHRSPHPSPGSSAAGGNAHCPAGRSP